MEGHARGSRDHRELTAAINLGNLVIPSGTGPGWARPSASCQGEPGIVKDMPPLRECGRGTDAGTEVEGHARGSGDHRNLNAAINLRNLIMLPGMGPGWARPEAIVQQRPSASCQGEPGIVKDVPPLRECGRGTDGGTVVEGPARGSWDHRN